MEVEVENKDDLATRMKAYEQHNEVFGAATLDAEKSFIVRLDGHRFSKFTSGFKKPYDERIFRAMLYTTRDLVEEFRATTGYTQSDEITLTFPPFKTEQTIKEGSDVVIFNGRIQKLISLMSGYCSVRFAYHLSSQTFDINSEKQLVDKIHKAYFDARVFHVPSTKEVLNNVIWRISDVKRNGVNNLGHSHFKQQELEGLSPTEVKEKLLLKGINWEDMPGPYKFGVLVKKGQFDKEGFNPQTNEKVVVARTKMCYCSLDIPQLKGGEKLFSEKLSNQCGEYHHYFVAVDDK